MKRSLIRPNIATLFSRTAIICSAATALSLHAQAPEEVSPSVGMSPPQVVRMLGAPIEKSEHETRREELWRYPKSVIRFREGKVVAVNTITQASERLTSPRAGGAPATLVQPATPDKTVNSAVFDEILHEIMQDKGSDTPATPPGPPGLGQVNPLGVPPAPPMPPVPGGMQGGAG